MNVARAVVGHVVAVRVLVAVLRAVPVRVGIPGIVTERDFPVVRHPVAVHSPYTGKGWMRRGIAHRVGIELVEVVEVPVRRARRVDVGLVAVRIAAGAHRSIVGTGVQGIQGEVVLPAVGQTIFVRVGVEGIGRPGIIRHRRPVGIHNLDLGRVARHSRELVDVAVVVDVLSTQDVLGRGQVAPVTVRIAVGSVVSHGAQGIEGIGHFPPVEQTVVVGVRIGRIRGKPHRSEQGRGDVLAAVPHHELGVLGAVGERHARIAAIDIVGVVAVGVACAAVDPGAGERVEGVEDLPAVAQFVLVRVRVVRVGVVRVLVEVDEAVEVGVEVGVERGFRVKPVALLPRVRHPVAVEVTGTEEHLDVPGRAVGDERQRVDVYQVCGNVAAPLEERGPRIGQGRQDEHIVGVRGHDNRIAGPVRDAESRVLRQGLSSPLTRLPRAGQHGYRDAG